MGNAHASGMHSGALAEREREADFCTRATQRPLPVADAKALAVQYTRRIIERNLQQNLAGVPPSKRGQQRAAATDAAAKAANALCDRWMKTSDDEATVSGGGGNDDGGGALPDGWERVVDHGHPVLVERAAVLHGARS